MVGRIVNLDGYDIGSPAEGQPYRAPSEQSIESRRLSLEREREQYLADKQPKEKQ